MSWAGVEDELARWRSDGRELSLWWRDDDAADATPELDRLLAVQQVHGMPLALAVVPAAATPAARRPCGGATTTPSTLRRRSIAC